MRPPHPTTTEPVRQLPDRFRPTVGELILVKAVGDLDLATADELDRTLRAAVADDGATRQLVVDLSDVTFLDCCALGVLVAARNRLRDRFWLASPSAPVTRLLELTGLTGVFGTLDGAPPVRLVPAGDRVRRTAGSRS